MPMILVVGAADTGRGPMTAALLRRLLEHRDPTLTVESAGVLGHDGDPATGDALATMDQLGIDLGEHMARSLTDELAEQATLLIAIDAGVARVARARFPSAATRIHTLGVLSGRARDIPDPFKMQIGAWLSYIREIDAMLTAAIPRILALVAEPNAETTTTAISAPSEPASPLTSTSAPMAIPAERAEAVSRICRLLDLAAQMPGVVDWNAARTRITADLEACVAGDPTDLAPALAALIRAALQLSPTEPPSAQLALLRDAAYILAAPVAQPALAAFSNALADWKADAERPETRGQRPQSTDRETRRPGDH